MSRHATDRRMKMQDWKNKDQKTGAENSGPENTRPENAEPENEGPCRIWKMKDHDVSEKGL